MYLSLSERAESYNKTFPKYPPVVVANGWLYGVWIMGWNYKGSGYYGSYPHGYLKRVMSMYPDAGKVLHLFSGSLGLEVKGDRLDLNPNLKPDMVGDAHRLSGIIKPSFYELILADPPYSKEDANCYGVPMINRNVVVKECAKILVSGGHLVWLDQVRPMYRKDEWNAVGAVGLIRSTNHRVRMVFIFERR